MKKNNNRFLGWIAFLVLILILPTAAFAKDAVDTGRSASLTVGCIYDGNPLSGVIFDFYKAADIGADGEFTISEDFSGYSISLEQETVEGWRALAETMALYAIRDHISVVRQGSTDASGRVSLAELSAGMYLVYGHRYTGDDFVYTPEPFLVSLPSLNDHNEWYYDVEANCKGIGYSDPSGTTSVRVLKVWDDEGHETNRPTDVAVQLLRDDSVYDTVTLNAENNWRYQWENLSEDSKWSVVEKEVPENYNLLITNEGVTFVLTNSYTPVFSTVEVKKVWSDKGYENKRPAEIEILLLKDGQDYDTVALNDSNSWTYSWTDLEEGRDWTVKEKSVPEGYTASIAQNGGKYTITNTYTPDEPHLPQTGQLWWPIPALIGVGLVCYLIGFLRLKTGKKRDE